MEPDPYIFGPSGSVIFCTDPDPSHHHAKIVRKTLISAVLRLFYDFLSLKDDVIANKITVEIQVFLNFLRADGKIQILSSNYGSGRPKNLRMLTS